MNSSFPINSIKYGLRLHRRSEFCKGWPVNKLYLCVSNSGQLLIASTPEIVKIEHSPKGIFGSAASNAT